MTGEGYQPRRCECGHTSGDHQSAGTSWPHPSNLGLCFIKGCGCLVFRLVEADAGNEAS